jgi:hypothetical protein
MNGLRQNLTTTLLASVEFVLTVPESDGYCCSFLCGPAPTFCDAFREPSLSCADPCVLAQ